MTETLDLTGLSKKERRALKKEMKQETSNKNSWRSLLLWGGAITAIIAVVVWVALAGKAKPATVVSNQEVVEADWKRGAKEPKVTIVEYSDLQCPACAAYKPLIDEMLTQYPDDLRLVYRHFPLRQLHLNAQLAAQAAEAAGNQGKFWEWHDLLFERQEAWAPEKDPREIFLTYAKELGLDEEKFKQDLESEETKQKVEDDVRLGLEARVSATPTLILNGKKITNPRSVDEFKRLIEQARQ